MWRLGRYSTKTLRVRSFSSSNASVSTQWRRYGGHYHQSPPIQRLSSHQSFSRSFSTVQIGQHQRELGPWPEKRRDLLPIGYLSPNPSPATKTHLAWMLQKDLLGQDMLLLGSPSTNVARRHLALAYAELTRRQVHVVSITADMTEADLKQRRELVAEDDGLRLAFCNAAPVEAAIEGRILILDGLEKASRNVLPTLNNLLEHRSMNLEDGRLLIDPVRYRELENPPDHLVPVLEDFRVIATAVPAPPYVGRSLDPPLRSRFQIRRVNADLDALYENGVDREWIQLASIMEEAAEREPGRLWPLSLDRVHSIAQLKEQAAHRALLRAYPLGVDDDRIPVLTKHEESRKALEQAWMTAFGTALEQSAAYTLQSIERTAGDSARITLVCQSEEKSWLSKIDPKSTSIDVPCGRLPLQELWLPTKFRITDGLRTVLVDMLQSHAQGDLLLLGPPGESKSATVNYFASLLGYRVTLVHAFPEMTATDLLLRRVTDPATGETSWEPSALLTAMKKGDLCVLDNVDKLRGDVLSSLSMLYRTRCTLARRSPGLDR